MKVFISMFIQRRYISLAIKILKLQKYIPEELVKAEQLYTQYLENLNSLKMSKCYYQNAKESFYSDSKEQYDKVRDLESSGSGKTFYFNEYMKLNLKS